MKRRGLTPEEKRLWKYVTRNDRPLGKEEPLPEEDALPEQAPPLVKKTRRVLPPTPPKPNHNVTGIASGNYAGIDRNTAEKFRKGNYPIEASLDLHGMTQKRAHEALIRFIGGHYEKNSRCLLVITGKGLRHKEGEQGILKKSLPLWLSDLSPMILAFDTAKPKHGGTGAYYILLKRKR